ncbi:MAG: NAD(P)-binding protein [Gammaproteobacteria bacterium]|nr:NAD(P)-binding protein [Gammaproteobacteria bacterium]
MSSHYTVESMPPKPLPREADIVIVGAGMSGLYVAWRLLQQDPERSVCIVDRINRTGGRLDSDLVHFPDGSTVKEEQGGMRFTFDTMDNLMSLFLLLGLDKEIVPFPMNSGGNNRLYFRGHAFTNAQAKEDDYAVWGELYNLDQAEQGIDPKSIIITVFNRILAANPQFESRPDPRPPEFWQAFRLECQWNNVKLIDWSLWNLLMEMGYSNECVTLLYRLLGFNGTFLSQMNAGEAFQLLEDFPADPQFFTLVDGFSGLPNKLVDAVGMERIHLLTTVESLSKRGDGSCELLTHNTETGERHSIVAKEKVVLALPRLALEKLFLRSSAFAELPPERADSLWNTLLTTTDQALLKINLYYDYAWWGNNLSGQPPVDFGPNFSDLPLGSVYPFYAIDEALFAGLEYQNWLKANHKTVPPELVDKLDCINDSKFNKPAALTIYCDFLNINFWRALQENGPRFESPLQHDHNEAQPQKIYPASQAVVREATGFFKKLFNSHYVPAPILTSARIWAGTTELGVPASRQVGYGVHQWGMHADDREVIASLVEPVPGIHTCGEAFSDYQGWVEGALRSADQVLAEFGLEPIAKVYCKEYGEPAKVIRSKYKEFSTERIKQYITRDLAGGADVADAAALDQGYDLKLSYFDK